MNIRNPWHRILYGIELILLGTFLLVYTCGNSVLWLIWTFEHDDLECFYSCDGSNGISYVNSILQDDHTSAEKNIPAAAVSFSMLIKSCTAVSLSETLINGPIGSEHSLFQRVQHVSSLNGHPTLIFHPPAYERIQSV